MKAFQPSCSGSKQRIFAAVELDFGAGNPNHGDNNLVSVLFSRLLSDFLLHPPPPYQLFGSHGRFFFSPFFIFVGFKEAKNVPPTVL